jgi:hypothetical protein
MVVDFDGKDSNLSLRMWAMSQHNLCCQIRADDNFYDGKVSLIDGASVTIILCLHVLIAHRIYINFGYVE